VPEGRVRAPRPTSTTCYPATFTLASVATTPRTPFAVTVTDLTPPTGGSTPNGEINDSTGIHGHRVEKEIRLKIDVRDGTGLVPDDPVLVSLTVDGPHAGTLIKDPSGARTECQKLVFLWHDRDSQGTLIPNEEVGFRLGTYSRLEGFENDATAPGGHRPVWGTAETINLQIWTTDAGGLVEVFSRSLPVKAEPGKPDHLAGYDFLGNLDPDIFKFWNGYRLVSTFQSNPSLRSSPFSIYNAFSLYDVHGNLTYGYTNTRATSPATNVTMEFLDQTATGPYYNSYRLKTEWNDSPALPAGDLTAWVHVDYPADPEWPAGTVTKQFTYRFEGGQTKILNRHKTYDQIRPDGTTGIDDGSFPIKVKPRATGALLPKTSAGDGRRLVLLTLQGDKTWGIARQPEPVQSGSRVWVANGPNWRIDRVESQPVLNTSERPSFRFTAVDQDWNPVEDLEFAVHFCPRFDHDSFGTSCSASPVTSTNGKILSLTANPANGARGYLGLELTRAPQTPGHYFVLVESIEKSHRIRRQSDLSTENATNDDEYRGSFAFADVDEQDCVDGRCLPTECNKCTGSPNFVGSGLYTATATDMVLPTAGFPITVSRRYLSAPNIDGTAGRGWVTSLESRIFYTQMSYGKALNVMLPEGIPLRFTQDTQSGAFVPVSGRKDVLVKKIDGSFELTLEKSRTVYRYNTQGRLQSMTDEYGNALTYLHGPNGQLMQITDGAGRFVDVTWGANNRIQTLRDHTGRTIVYTHDGQGLLSTVSDPLGRLTRYEYRTGTFGPLLNRIADPWNRTLSQMTYDEVDRTKTYTEHGETYTYEYVDAATVKKTDTQGNLWTYTVGDGGLITSRTPQGNSGTQTTYNADGSIATTVDEAGVTTSYSYLPNGQVFTVTRDLTGTPVTFRYLYDQAFPEKVTSVDALSPDWQSWRYEYFPQGSAAPGSLKAVKRVRTDGTTLDTLTTYTYDVKGRILSQTSSSGATTDYTYDGRGNLQTVTGPSNNDGGTRPSTTYAYDSLDRVNSVTDPNSKTTSYTYDLLGRIQTVTLPKPSSGSTLNFTTTYSYDNFDSGTGLVYTHITDPNGRVTKLGYDEHGRLIRSVDASNQATVYGYTRSLLTSITDANGNVTSYLYDALKRLAKTTFPDQREETYTYWPDGLLKTKTDRKGQTVTYTYDAHKRLVNKSYSTGGSITYTYQGQKLMQVLDTTITPNETHSFGYDDAYRVTTNTQGPRGSLTYTYGADDRVATMQIGSGPSTSYGYHPDGSLRTITWSPIPGNFTYVYNPNGQYSEVTFPNGQKRTYTYDDQGRLTQLANTFNSNPLATFAYGYDVDQQTGQATMLGQRVTVTETLPHQGLVNALMKFGYDPQYQLSRAEYPSPAPFNGEIHSWSYDAIGNRLTNTVNATTQTYAYLKNGQNPLNGQKLTNDGTNAYTYDFNGNTLSRTGYGFTYDAENRLTSITGNETASYTYDYQGRRTSKTVAGVTTTYIYDGLNLIAETAAGQTSYFLNGAGIDEPLAMSKGGQIAYLVSDGLGSIVATNDPTGTVTHSVAFDAWGNTKSEVGARMHPFTYTGREVGDAGLLHYRARQYQSAIGRFTSEDPLRSDQIGLYPYVGNSPLEWIDPTGMFRQGDVVYRCKDSLSCDVVFVWSDPTPDIDGNGDETILAFGPSKNCKACSGLPDAHAATMNGPDDPYAGYQVLGYWRPESPDSRTTYQDRWFAWPKDQKYDNNTDMPNSQGQCYNLVNHMSGLSQWVLNPFGGRAGEVRGLSWWHSAAVNRPKPFLPTIGPKL